MSKNYGDQRLHYAARPSLCGHANRMMVPRNRGSRRPFLQHENLMPSLPSKRSSLAASRLLVAVTVLLAGASREMAAQTAAQTAGRSSSRLVRGTRVDATTTGRLCIGVSAPLDTVAVQLAPAAYSETQPAHWPNDLTARIVRQRPDELRHGVRFPRFQIVGFGPPFKDRVGRFGLLFPDPEDVTNPTGPHQCFPAGLTLHGVLSKDVRSSTRAK